MKNASKFLKIKKLLSKLKWLKKLEMSKELSKILKVSLWVKSLISSLIRTLSKTIKITIAFRKSKKQITNNLPERAKSLLFHSETLILLHYLHIRFKMEMKSESFQRKY